MVLSVVALMGLPALAHGHAFIYFPPLRGGAFNNPINGYEPQSMGSTNLPMPTCGKSKFLDYSDGPITPLEPGSVVQFQINVTAHHMGHFQFRLCDQPISSALGGFAAEEACLKEHVLERVRPEDVHGDCGIDDKRADCQPYDEANPGYWYLPPASQGSAVLLEEESSIGVASRQVKSHSSRASMVYRMHYRLPAGFTCERCTLQWWWTSANSCAPHPDAYRCYFQKMKDLGWNADAWCSGACTYTGTCPQVQGPAVNCGEQFKNCADVKIQQGSTQAEPPSPAETAEATTTSQPASTSEPESESEPEEENESESESEHEENESESESESEPEDESTQMPSTVSTTTPASVSGLRCTATPGLNRGVSDPDCARCEDGYQWWPCNEEILCTCTGSLLNIARLKKTGRGHSFLGLIQTSEDVQKEAWITAEDVEL